MNEKLIDMMARPRPAAKSSHGLALVLLLITLLGGCSFFSRQQSVDTNPTVTATGQADRWYCYGVAEDRSWDCAQQEDSAKIQAIVPDNEPQLTATAPPPVNLAPPPVPVAAPEAAPVPVFPEPAAIVADTGDPLTDRVLSLPVNHYAVQLIAMRNRDRVLEYAVENGIEEPIVVSVVNQEETWHLLLLGLYPDRAGAQAARDDWESTRVLRVRPWIRRLGPLQDAVRLALDES